MATKVHMEALSPTMEEGQLVRWLKAEGDPVSNGEVIAEIETDKATMELVARGDGILRKVLLDEGGTAPVGEVIAIIAGADEDIGEWTERSGPGSKAPESTSRQSEPEAVSPPKPDEAGLAGGSEEGAVPVPSVGEVGEPARSEDGEPGPDKSSRLKASPLARRVAKEADLDLRAVPGSGPGGRIIMRDVEAAMAAAGGGGPEPVGEGEERQRREKTGGAGYEDRPLSQMRKTIARRLVESLSPVPHFFLRVTVDMTRTLEARSRVNQLLEDEGEKVSINDFILKATAGALARHPEVNAQWKGDAIRRHFRVHLGVAVAVDDGLITPVIRDADRKGLSQISREMRELAARGREKKLQPEEYTGSTFSVSNLGMFGIHEFTGVINPPEAGILAVGGIEDTPVAVEGQVVVRPLMKVTMSCDHRVVDGATGARFLKTLKDVLEEPAAILI
jgi:pyruvate dehydrogenase E2 component (dihydrolipoamide acetyltransferase)